MIRHETIGVNSKTMGSGIAGKETRKPRVAVCGCKNLTSTIATDGYEIPTRPDVIVVPQSNVLVVEGHW